MPNTLFDVTTIGEALLRLSVPMGNRLEMASCLDVNPAGAEANMGVIIGQLGRDCAWFGGLPNNPLGRLVANRLLASKVDIGGVVWMDSGRMGVYYVELAGPPRPTKGIYDRDDSCAAKLTVKQIDWDRLMDTRILHLTGITPALSGTSRKVVETVVQKAREQQIPICLDVNYRAQLWSTSEARQTLIPLIEEIEILICSLSDADRVFGFRGESENVVKRLSEMTGAHWVIVSVGTGGVVAYNRQEIFRQEAVPVEIVDRIGAGDALAAGVLYGWLKEDLQLGLRYGVVLAGLALSQHGDMVVTSEEEVQSILKGGQGGIKR
jgi:2-dehydro-3-deoxygluconokinase